MLGDVVFEIKPEANQVILDANDRIAAIDSLIVKLAEERHATGTRVWTAVYELAEAAGKPLDPTRGHRIDDEGKITDIGPRERPYFRSPTK